MKNYSKEQIMANLMQEVSNQLNDSNRKIRLKGRINNVVLDMVKKVQLYSYINVESNSKSGLNKGNIVENIMLYLADLDHETERFEVKYFGNDTANTLVNANTEKVYIVVNKATLKGVYYTTDMQALLGKRITLTYFMEHIDSFKKHNTYTKRLGLDY